MISRTVAAALVLASALMAGLPQEQAALDPAAGALPFAVLPVFPSDAGDFIGLSFVNTSEAPNTVTLTWVGPEGKSMRTASLPMAPASQHTALVTEVLGLDEGPAEGWIRIQPSGAGLLAYLASGQEGTLDGTEPATAVSTRVLLPHISVNTGFMELEHTDTQVILVNPGAGAAGVHAELIGLDGSVAGALNISIPPEASRTLRISESFRDALPSNGAGGRVFRGYMRVSADTGLAGWLRIDKPLSRGLYRGSGVEEIAATRLALVSHFAYGSPDLYRSELNIINAGQAAVTLELAAQDDRGGILGEAARRTLLPGQGLREDVFDLFRIVVPEIYPPPLVTGYIRVRAAEGGVFQAAGNIHMTSWSAAAMLYPMETRFPSRAILPFVITEGEYFTGYALANPNELLTVQTDVTVELLDGEGRPVGAPRSVSLSPAARFASLVEGKVRSGYVRIRANGSVAVLGAIGSRGGSMLAPLPAELPDLPSPVPSPAPAGGPR